MPRALPPLTMQVVSSWKRVRLVKHDLFLVKPWYLFLTIFLSFHVLWNRFYETCSTMLPGPELMPTGLYFLDLLLCLFCRRVCYLPFSSYSVPLIFMTLQRWKSGFAMMSTNSQHLWMHPIRSSLFMMENMDNFWCNANIKRCFLTRR